MLDRFPVPPSLRTELLAQMLSWDCANVTKCERAMAAAATDLARAMLTDPEYRDAVHALPFREGDRVAAIGDSLTADRLGWFELLIASVRLADGNDVVAHNNLGVSGSTTADALERFDILEAFRPTHVLVMLGTNDARRHGRWRDHRMVTATQTRRTLSALLDLLVEDLQADVFVITPPPADQSRIASFFHDSPVRWSAAELDAVAQIVRDVEPHCIDVHATLQAYDLGDVMEADGVHLNVPGQQLLARAVVQAMATGDSSRTRPPASSAIPGYRVR